MATTKTSVELSIPKSRKVRGYEIKRLPLGKYLAAMQLLGELPKDVVVQLFPDAQPGDVLGQLAELTKDGLQALVLRALATLPSYTVRLLAQLMDLDEDTLLDDPAVGLDGLAEMALVWVEVNGLENFIKAAGALAGKVRKAMLTRGSNG